MTAHLWHALGLGLGLALVAIALGVVLGFVWPRR